MFLVGCFLIQNLETALTWGKDAQEADRTLTSWSEMSVNVLAARVPTRRLS